MSAAEIRSTDGVRLNHLESGDPRGRADIGDAIAAIGLEDRRVSCGWRVCGGGDAHDRRDVVGRLGSTTATGRWNSAHSASSCAYASRSAGSVST